MNETQTPMMRQYYEIKREHQDKVLFFRLGDFYEMFSDDAEEISKLLNLTLTHRGKEKMCGIPHHAVKNYLKRLLDYGKKIAICEQFVEPGSRDIAVRKVTQIITPATVIDDDFLDIFSSSYVLAVKLDKTKIYLSWADISTGEFYIRSIRRDESFSSLESVLVTVRPKEILVEDDCYYSDKVFRNVIDRNTALVTKLPKWYFSVKDGKKMLEKQFSQNALRLNGISERDPILTAVGSLLSYLYDMSKTELPQLRAIERIEDETYLEMNDATVRNLEISESMNQDKNTSLFSAVNRTLTPSGSRYLKFALLHPLTDIGKINSRLEWISFLLDNRDLLNKVRDDLKDVRDVERLAVKASLKRLNPRDFIALSHAITSFSSILSSDNRFLSLLEEKEVDISSLVDFAVLVNRAINPECTNINNRGTIILDGYDRELDELRYRISHSATILDEYLEKVKKETGITIIKIGNNRIIGNYIEVPNGQKAKVPSYFTRRQTLVNGERFTSPELVAISDEINTAEERAASLEKQIFSSLLKEGESLYLEFDKMAKILTKLDYLSSGAVLADEENYTRPEIIEDDSLEIEGGRHPVVERFIGKNSFVSNPFSSGKSRFSLITGPNMAGKSTYLRQIALITILAHSGYYVPAKSARIPLTDKIFCRVGASDNLAQGESTFLVEMSESSHILRSATPKSLVIMDEIGRGTSTEDGMSIAYGIMQYLIKLNCITLFSTHYHELTELDIGNVQMLHMLVKEDKGEIIFLRKVAQGTTDSSYGIHVAKLAGLPKEVIKEAKDFLKGHFESFSSYAFNQTTLFQNEGEENNINDEIIEKIHNFDIDTATPISALLFLSEIKNKLDEK